MIRILQCVNIMDRAGLETMLMNYYRHMDRSVVQFDFLTHREESGAYDAEIEKMGGRVYHAPRLYPQNYGRYFHYMKQFFVDHPEYLVVHSHIDSMSYFPLLAAKKSDIPVRIGHSHTSSLDKDLKFPIKLFALKKMPKIANVYFSCGEKAGTFMYPRDSFRVIHNAIELQLFQFDEQIRAKVRRKMNLVDSFVVGHVGRFCSVKNQLFLLEVFKELIKLNPNSSLVLVGSGPDEEKIRKKTQELGVESRVRILVDRSDVNELYQAFDIFVMPSLFEGLPVVGAEAQASGLPCIFSDTISKEVILSDNAEQLSLEYGAAKWAERIMEKDSDRNRCALHELQEKGYDIRIEAKKLQAWYLETYQRAEDTKIK